MCEWFNKDMLTCAFPGLSSWPSPHSNMSSACPGQPQQHQREKHCRALWLSATAQRASTCPFLLPFSKKLKNSFFPAFAQTWAPVCPLGLCTVPHSWVLKSDGSLPRINISYSKWHWHFPFWTALQTGWLPLSCWKHSLLFMYRKCKEFKTCQGGRMQSRSHLPREYQVLPQPGREEDQKIFLSSDRVSGTFTESCWPGNS